MAREMNPAKIKALADWLKNHDDIAIVTHVNPDGDALGSSLALWHALTAMGKRAFVCDRDEVPAHLRMLPGWEKVVLPADIPFAPRAVLAVDCADAARMGSAGELMKELIETAVIDHHETNATTITPALVDAGASASGVLVHQVLRELDAPMTDDIALCLYIAISTDTGNFAFSNTTPDALTAVAECLKQEIDLADVNFRLFRMRSAARTKLLGRALNSMEYLADGKMAVLQLTLADFAETGADDADTEGVVNFGIDTEGVEVSILAVERLNNTKFSLRSRHYVNVAQVAHALGGGGHSRAAGVTVQLPLKEAVDQVVAAFLAALEETPQ